MGTHFTQHSSKGFTIIETMLVLAVTGLLIASLLVGIGSTIARQRYSDSVVTLKSQLQDQFARVDNVSNERDASWTCGSSATPVEASAGIAPGQSKCVLLGRYITIIDDKMVLATVTGYPLTDTDTSDDITSIKSNYTLGISTSSIQNSSLEWGAKIAWPSQGATARTPTSPRSIAILIIRSPDTGATYTFTSDTVPANIADVSDASLKAMLVQDSTTVPGQLARTLCVDPDGVAVPEKLAIVIAGAASGPGAIEVKSPQIIANTGSDTRC